MLVRVTGSWDGGDVPPDPDGFVHLSWPDQVAETIKRHHATAASLTFLVVDEAGLPAGSLRVEDTSGHGAFPHLYATLPAAAVSREVPWRRGEPIVLREPATSPHPPHPPLAGGRPARWAGI